MQEFLLAYLIVAGILCGVIVILAVIFLLHPEEENVPAIRRTVVRPTPSPRPTPAAPVFAPHSEFCARERIELTPPTPKAPAAPRRKPAHGTPVARKAAATTTSAPRRPQASTAPFQASKRSTARMTVAAVLWGAVIPLAMIKVMNWQKRDPS